MSLQLVLPMVAAFAATLPAGLVQRRLPPVVGTWLFTALGVVTAASAVWAVGTLGLGWLSEQAWLEDWLGWCRAVVSHHDDVPTVVGLPAMVLLSAMLGHGARTAWIHRRAARCRHEGDAVEFIAADEPFAYALPGRPGHVVVSTGMLCCLEAEERTVLLAHEEAHLALRHHRFLAAAHVAASTFPLLRPLRAQVRFATERWADEVAAANVGDRSVVARALARAAVAQADHAAAPAFGGLGVLARVEAMLAGPTPRAVAAFTLTVGVGAAVSSMIGAAIQLHHLVQLAAHACGLS